MEQALATFSRRAREANYGIAYIDIMGNPQWRSYRDYDWYGEQILEVESPFSAALRAAMQADDLESFARQVIAFDYQGEFGRYSVITQEAWKETFPQSCGSEVL